MKKYKFRLVSTKNLIYQIKDNSEKLRQTKNYLDYTLDTILDLLSKVKKLNIELSKLEVETKSLKHDSYKIKDVQMEKNIERGKLDKVLMIGLNDFVFKINLLLDDMSVIFLDSLTLLYRKYKELMKDEKSFILRERIKNIARDLYETSVAREETVITQDVFEKRKENISREIEKDILEIEKIEGSHSLEKIGLELKDIHDIGFDVTILVPKIEEIIPKIDSETYLLNDDMEGRINKEIRLIKKKIEEVKFLINNQARMLYEEIKVVS